MEHSDLEFDVKVHAQWNKCWKGYACEFDYFVQKYHTELMLVGVNEIEIREFCIELIERYDHDLYTQGPRGLFKMRVIQYLAMRLEQLVGRTDNELQNHRMVKGYLPPIGELPHAVCVYVERSDGILGTTRRFGHAIGLPGGKRDLGELDIEAIVRETREETGVILDPNYLIKIFDQPCGPGTDGRVFQTVGYFYTGSEVIEPRMIEDGIFPGFWTREHFYSGAFPEYNYDFFKAVDLYLGR